MKKNIKLKMNQLEMNYQKRIRSEIKLYQNLPIIFEKTEQEGSIKLITQTFENILQNETYYAITGNLKRIKKIPQKCVTK